MYCNSIKRNKHHTKTNTGTNFLALLSYCIVIAHVQAWLIIKYEHDRQNPTLDVSMIVRTQRWM